MPTLSIVIPAYNEERFIGTLLEQIQAVDLAPLGVGQRDHRRRRLLDGSDAPRSRRRSPGVRAASACRHNGGKGQAVRAGIALATGDLPDHPGRRSRVRPAATTCRCCAALLSRAAATSSTAAAIMRARAPCRTSRWPRTSADAA